MKYAYYILPALVACFCLFWMFEAPFRKRRKYFLARPVLNCETWCDRYYGGTDVIREVAVEVAAAFAAEIGCSPWQLLPTDEIGGNLSLADYGVRFHDSFELADIIFEDALHKWGLPSPLDNSEWRTMDDVIRAVSIALGKKSQAS